MISLRGGLGNQKLGFHRGLWERREGAGSGPEHGGEQWGLRHGKGAEEDGGGGGAGPAAGHGRAPGS